MDFWIFKMKVLTNDSAIYQYSIYVSTQFNGYSNLNEMRSIENYEYLSP